MTSTAKTVLIVGGSAAGAYLLLKLLTPKPASARASSYNSLTTPLAIAGLLPSLSSLFQSQSTSYAFPSHVDTPGQAAYGASHDVLDVEGNQLVDLNTGNYVVYGTD